MKMNLVYNSEIRDDGTPRYFLHAFHQLEQEQSFTFERYLPYDKLPKADFTVCIDDGRDEIKWLPEHPCGYYATDTHLGWDYRLWKAKHFDIVWCAQKPAAEKMRELGINASWLPLACDPMAHPTRKEWQDRGFPSTTDKYDIVFVGHLQSPKTSTRVEFLDSLYKAIPNFRTVHGLFHEDMAHQYHKARIGVNHAVRDDLNMRFFELASCGVPQLCDRRMVGLRELGFADGIDYIGYSSTDEAIDRTKFYLAHPNNLDLMADLSHAIVRASHTYKHRAEKMLKDIHDLRGN